MQTRSSGIFDTEEHLVTSNTVTEYHQNLEREKLRHKKWINDAINNLKVTCPIYGRFNPFLFNEPK